MSAMNNRTWLIIDTKKILLTAVLVGICWFFWPKINHYYYEFKSDILSLRDDLNGQNEVKSIWGKITFWK